MLPLVGDITILYVYLHIKYERLNIMVYETYINLCSILFLDIILSLLSCLFTRHAIETNHPSIKKNSILIHIIGLLL